MGILHVQMHSVASVLVVIVYLIHVIYLRSYFIYNSLINIKRALENNLISRVNSLLTHVNSTLCIITIMLTYHKNVSCRSGVRGAWTSLNVPVLLRYLQRQCYSLKGTVWLQSQLLIIRSSVLIASETKRDDYE